jgi:BolA protein
MNRVEAIRERLTAELAPLALEITDDSHKHAGHASAGGGGHFRVDIVAAAFHGQGTVQRHRMVYAALAELMQQNEVHALSIQARTPDET